MTWRSLPSPLLPLLAAALFGLSVPVSKALLDAGAPGLASANLLAGLLYLGSGAGLSIALVVKRMRKRAIAGLPRKGLLRFAGAVFFGGVCAPVLLMVGLTSSAATTSSVLLNLEGVFTALLAWLVVREHTDRRNVIGMLLIVAGCIALSLDVSGAFPFSPGALAVIGACACWGIDNNLTQAVSAADPSVVAGVKGIVAGAVNVTIAVALGTHLPSAAGTVEAMTLGFVSYGASLVLFVVSLSRLGTARTGAYFATAPFIGAALSFAMFHEAVGARFVVGIVLSAAGVWLHLSERHGHRHHHHELTHTHEHVHDEHHQHPHGATVADATKPHVHEHTHEPTVHAHAHAPDLHHRHSH